MATNQLADSHTEQMEDDVYVPPQVTAYAEAEIIDNIAELCTGSSDQGGCFCPNYASFTCLPPGSFNP